ncbi:MAG: maltotransferase domain-containing protein, partial [Verrucomicrobiota bacterium]|nr:maltotransferase domain-containing protein [Verrucomicrobiota bacterium]
MSFLAKPADTRRVVIDKVYPSIDCGSNPFKRVIGDWIAFSAHAFADSHDLIQVELRIRKINTKSWQVFPMVSLGNDEFEATYCTDSV